MTHMLPKQTVTKRLKKARQRLAFAEGKADDEMVPELGVPAWLCRKVDGREVQRLEEMQQRREAEEKAQ